MKNNYLFFLLTILVMSGCKKTNDEEKFDHQIYLREIGAVKPGTKPVRAILSQTGGELTSADGTISVNVPEGAVNANTTFEIQEVISTLEGNRYPTYKLLPEGIHFNKPIRIIINYKEFPLTGSSAEMLTPAYQAQSGIYYLAKDYSNDKISKTIEIKTTHFSSWTLYDNYRLEGPNEVGTNGNVQIKLMTYPLLTDLSGNETLQPWDEASIPDALGRVDERLKTVEWKLAGEGDLSPQRFKCIYGAPSIRPVMNPVMLSLSMIGKFERNGPASAKYTLLYPIRVIGDEYFTANIDGIEHEVSSGVVLKLSNSFGISGLVDGKRPVSLTVHGTGKGSYPFGILAGNGKAHLSYGYDGSNFVQSLRSACSLGEPDVITSPGQVNITSYPGKTVEYMEGTITGAILYHQYDFCNNQVLKKFSMSFRLKAL